MLLRKEDFLKLLVFCRLRSRLLLEELYRMFQA
jgi:hypothetical protein